MNKRTLLIDFDGVLHSYTSGWQGARVIPDPPVEGALEFLRDAVLNFDVCIYSSRSKAWGGRQAIKNWLIKSFVDAATPYEDCPEWLKNEVAAKAFADPWKEDARAFALELLRAIRFPITKPAAFLTLDDRCICFNGKFPDPQELLAFKPWNKQQKKEDSR